MMIYHLFQTFCDRDTDQLQKGRGGVGGNENIQSYYHFNGTDLLKSGPFQLVQYIA